MPVNTMTGVKPAGLHPLLAARRSLRAYAERPVEPEKLRLVLEAGRWAPSFGNRQPWRFIAVTDRAALERLHRALTPGNAWARRAPAVIVVAARPDDAMQVDGKPYYLFDCGLAVQSMLLQAVALGLLAHPIGGWHEAGVKEALAIPEDVRVVVLVVLGYQGSPDVLDEEARRKDERPPVRRPLEETAYADVWGRPVP